MTPAKTRSFPLPVPVPLEEHPYQARQHPGSRESGGEELRQLPFHAGHLHRRRGQAPDCLPAVQGVGRAEGCPRPIGVPWENPPHTPGRLERRLSVPPTACCCVKHSVGVKADVSAVGVSLGVWVPGKPCPCLCGPALAPTHRS